MLWCIGSIAHPDFMNDIWRICPYACSIDGVGELKVMFFTCRPKHITMLKTKYPKVRIREYHTWTDGADAWRTLTGKVEVSLLTNVLNEIE